MLKFIRARALIALPIAAALLSLSACQTTVAPKTYEKTGAVKTLLWAGNSYFYYNNSMHGHVGQLLTNAGGTGYRQTSVTISGAGINWHSIEAHYQPGGVGSYSFTPKNEVRFNTFSKAFDATMVMDCSQCPIHPQMQATFFEYAKKHSDTARKYGSEPIFFSSWAYQDKPEMAEQLLAEYVKAGKQNNALVVPAGRAFANSLQKRPDLNLHDPDKRHPSLMGTYLGACTVMASVFKQNPVGNKYTAGLAPEVALHLQTVAWETAQAFHAREGRGSLQ